VFDAISADGEYLGGAIAPGLRVSAESLYAATSQLRRVELTAPPAAIGKNTTQSIQSGLIFGYTGMIEHMVHLYRREMNTPSATVVATGGLAPIIAEQTAIFTYMNLDLTLQGLRLIFNLNPEQLLAAKPHGGLA
jgi:type III pantothenate kinase